MSSYRELIEEQRVPIALILTGTIGLVLSFLNGFFEYLIAVPIILCGIPIIYGAIVGVCKEHDITADVLVSVAIVASVFIGEYEAAAEISIIMQIGALLEEMTVSKANSGMIALLSIKPETAKVLTPEGEIVKDVSKVVVGDVVRVMPGETVPVDGTIVSGSTSIDTSILTGESVPKDVSVGDKVSAGTVNMFGSMDVTVERTGDDSTISRMAKLLENADAGKSKIVRTADRWAVWIVIIALTVSILTYIVTRDIYRSVTVLVVFCPCALILATPTAIMAAAGNLSRRGILVKDGAALENISSTDTVLMDKTGTLTTGNMMCMGFTSTSDHDVPTLTMMASSVEKRSEHPLGKAIADHCDGCHDVENFEYIPGEGVSGMVDGRTVTVGNKRLLERTCLDNLEGTIAASMKDMESGMTVVYIGIDGRTSGYAMLSDTVKPGSRDAVEELRLLGLKTVMLTGDSEKVARSVRESVGLDDVVWECLPEDKLSMIERMGSEKRTCMVGDGINDAPSLKRADVSIAMGGIGSDMAIEAADIILTDDDISKVPAIFRMGRRTLLTIKVGIAFSLILNSIAMIMAVLGLMGPIAGALVHNIGSVIVIIGAAMLLTYDCWNDKGKHDGKTTS